MSIADLPAEVLTRVFAFYVKSEGLYELLTRVACVSKEWKAVAMNPSLWKVVDETRLSPKDLCRASKSGFLTQTVKLILRQQISMVNEREFKCILSGCRKLKHLDVSENALSENMLACIAMVRSCIESLDLNRIKVTIDKRNMSPILRAYGPHLRCLNLSNNSFSNFAEVITEIAGSCPNLEELRIGSMSGTGLFFPVANVQVGCPKLKVLELGSCRYFSKTSEAVQGFPDLEAYLSPVEIGTGPCGEDLNLMLRHSAKLRALDIRGCLVTYRVLMEIPSENLQILYLANSAVVDVNIDRVIGKWKHSLKDLDLSNTFVSEHIMFAALHSLVHYNSEPSLEALDLSCTSVTLPILQLVIRKCRRLKYLNIMSCMRLPRSLDHVYTSYDEMKSILTIHADLIDCPQNCS